MSMTGRIAKKFDGYGFIDGDDKVGGRSTRYFFIPSGLQKTADATFDDLRVGDRMEFEAIVHPKGPRAIEVRRTGLAPDVEGNR